MRPIILVLSLLLGVVCMAGVAWIFISGMITIAILRITIDGLFMTLILLTLAACFLLNAYWEMRDRGLDWQKEKPAGQSLPGGCESELTMATHTATLSHPWECRHPRA